SAAAFQVGGNPQSVTAADLNHDGMIDLITVNIDYSGMNNDNTMSILLGRGDGTFGSAESYMVGNDPGAKSVSAVDVNKDGNVDVVIAYFHSSTQSVLLGRGDGTFGPELSYPIEHAFAASADANNDGNLD